MSLPAPYYDQDGITIYHADCQEILPEIDPASIDLVLTDPPYFRVKDDPWDRQWDDRRAFLSWLGRIADEWRRVLMPNGSLYVFASPDMTWHVEGVVRERFTVLNSARWLKDEGWHNKAKKEALRSFLSPWEAVIFAEQSAGGVSPVAGEVMRLRIAAGMTRDQVDVSLGYVRTKDPARGTELCRRWEEGSSLPSREDFNRLAFLAADDRRRDYDDLCRPFAVSDRCEWSDIWRFKTVPALPSKHPCEKPVALMEHIIRASTRPGALVLDSFAGSGSALVAARNLGRKAIGIDASERWCERAMRRLQQAVLPLEIPA